MKLGKTIAVGVPLALGAAALAAHLRYRGRLADADEAWRSIRARPAGAVERFDPGMIADQPEIARRYFNHAIAPGTPLAQGAELTMRGTFLLGDKGQEQAYAMRAEEILRPPFEFLWKPVLKSKGLTISGSDGLAANRAWTRFWLMSVVTVASSDSSPDLVRSAQFRAASEGLWVPSSLLPANGVRWEQIGPDKARLTFERVEPAVVLELTLAASGAVRQVVGQRWSNANPEHRFQLQPFGGTAEGEARFGGYRIPARLAVGNHYGTDRSLPFFQAEVTGAVFF